MRKSLRVFRRDVARIGRVPRTWIIVFGVIVTPALYAWFNINAFWDPYANTANVRVAVVNLDDGASSDLTGRIDIGSQVVDELKDNDQLGWQFTSEQDARDAVARGDAYAALIIPKTFSHDLLTITTGTFTQPGIEYVVNEKANAIAPKITDVGASEIDSQITGAFAKEVADAATTELKKAGVDVSDRIDQARSDALGAFDEASGTISDARADLDQVRTDIATSRSNVAAARGTLADLDQTLAHTQTAIGQAQALVSQIQQPLLIFTNSATSAYVQSATLIAQASADAATTAGQISTAFGQGSGAVGTAIGNLQTVAAQNAAALAQLQALVDAGGLDPATTARLNAVIADLQQRNAADQQLLQLLATANTDNAAAVAAISDAANAASQAAAGAQQRAGEVSNILAQSVPALNSALSSLSTNAGALSAALGAQRTQLTQAGSLLGAVDTQLAATSDAIANLDQTLAGVDDGIATARTDIAALGAASSIGGLSTIAGLDPNQIADFIASPVTLDTQKVFPVANYGSAMAALFTNLSLWIGAFVLMVIFKVEVDTDGIEDLTVREAYVGRFLLFAVLGVLQALVVCIGNLVIGIQTVSALAFVGTGVLVSLAYVSIVYALCVTFGHVGRGLCVLLVAMQIPGASGLYPIEMMPDFFRAIYPLLPFTYGIDAMRETIAGFFGSRYLVLLGALGIFVLLAWIVGLVLRRRFANLNLVFNREIAATDLLVAENVQVTGSGYRLGDVIHALADREEYRDDLARRAHRFTTHYRQLVWGGVIAGVVGAAVLATISAITVKQAPALLFIWMLWVLAIIGFLVTVEYFRQSYTLAAEVGELDDDELRRRMLSHGPQRVMAGSRPPEASGNSLILDPDAHTQAGTHGGTR